MHQPLWATLVDVVGAVMPPEDPTQAGAVRVTGVTMDLPINVMLERTAAGLEFMAELPGWRWQTVFDRRPGRLKITCAAGAGP